MLPDQFPGADHDEVSSERRLSSVRLFVIRNGRLVELERRERPDPVVNETRAPYLTPPGAKLD
jgi:hypothetical protein